MSNECLTCGHVRSMHDPWGSVACNHDGCGCMAFEDIGTTVPVPKVARPAVAALAALYGCACAECRNGLRPCGVRAYRAPRKRGRVAWGPR